MAAGDEIRLLARNGKPRYRTLPNGRQIIDDRDRADTDIGYTADGTRALADAGEAVPSAYQAELSERAHNNAHRALETEWLKARERVLVALGHFAAVSKPNGQLRSDLRALERGVARIDQRLGR